MNKTQLIQKIAQVNELEEKNAEKFLNSLEEIITQQLKDGQEVTITGFGTFLAKHRHARMGVNPRNPSEKIHMPAVTVPKFRAGKSLKDALKHKNTESTESN